MARILHTAQCQRTVSGSESSAKMAGCHGVKKQKLNNSMPSSVYCNGGSASIGHPTNGLNGTVSIVRPEMCYFCFDVLYSHLHSFDSPKSPTFTNDAQ